MGKFRYSCKIVISKRLNLMYNQLFEFNSAEQDRFEIPESGLEMSIDRESKSLVVHLPDGTARTFSLDNKKVNQLPAIYVSGQSCLEVGKVIYPEQPLSETPFVLNNTNDSYTFTCRRGGGHLGILDIRDVSGKVAATTYYWDLVPIALAADTNTLWISTAECDQDLGPKRWYVKHKPGS